MTQLPPQPAPSGASAFQDPTQPITGGVPQTSQGQQFLLEEQAAYAARGEAFDSGGTLIPPQYAGDFWQLYQMAETFAANTGWKYLLTPAQLIEGLNQGMATKDASEVWAWMSNSTGAWRQGPWAGTGLSATQYNQQMSSLQDSMFELTGSTDVSSIGLNLHQALENKWSTAQLQDWILANRGDIANKYPYLKAGMNYQSFQLYKGQHADELKQRYGTTFSDAQAVENFTTPLSQFHAQGGAFGQATPYVKSDQAIPTGFQSGVR